MRSKDTSRRVFHWSRQPRMSRTKRIYISQSKKPWLFPAPSLVGTVLFILIPFADAVIRPFYQAVGGRLVGLKNFVQVWNSQVFHLAVRNTLRLILVRISFLMTFSLWTIVLATAAFKGGNVYKTTVLLPLVISAASVVLLWKVPFYPQGFLNQLVAIPGSGTRDWLGQNSAFYVLVFTYIWKNTGHNIMLWLASLDGIPLEFYKATRMDGTGSRQIFYYVTLPCPESTVFLATVLSIINSFKIFREAYLISEDCPHESTYMMQHLFNNWLVSPDTRKMNAISVTIELLVLIPVIIWVRRRNRK